MVPKKRERKSFRPLGPSCTTLTRAIQYYFCGSGKVALGVKDKLGDIVLEAMGGNKDEAAAYLAQLSKVSRFATDVFD